MELGRGFFALAAVGGAGVLGLVQAGGSPWIGVSASLGIAIGAALVLVANAHRERRARRAFERALAQRDTQLAHTVHELRTPLSAITTALELVRDGHATTPAEVAEFLGEADLATRQLTFLVNDVLDAAAIAAGRLRLELAEHAADELVAATLRLLTPQAEGRGVSIAATAPLPGVVVRTDARRVQQVLCNLIGNAVKFSAPGDRVELRLEPVACAVRFRVLDVGPGVPPAVAATLFAPFSGDDAAPRADGTGLGLCIARAIVEQLGGRIGHAPRSPRGAEFWFELPYAARAGGVVARHPAAAR
jgi:signal transduction histidine kinase